MFIFRMGNNQNPIRTNPSRTLELQGIESKTKNSKSAKVRTGLSTELMERTKQNYEYTEWYRTIVIE